MSKIYQYKRNTKALTLVEIVIALALMSIITIPVLSLVYSSVQNNKMTKVLSNSNTILSKAVEDIKSNPQKFIQKLEISNLYYENKDMTVLYEIEELEKRESIGDGLEKIPACDIELMVNTDTVILKDNKGIVGEYDINIPYILEINGQESPYEILFREFSGNRTIINQSTLADDDSIISVYIKFAKDRELNAANFVLYGLIDEEMDIKELVNVYIFGDSGVGIINGGNRKFNQYHNVNDNAWTFMTALYKLTVIAKKKNSSKSELGNMVSYIND